MCLLVKQPATTAFTDDFLRDVYQKNSDGLGVMYAEGGELQIYKALPTKAQDFIDFYREHAEGRDCVWHARMQTHGDIDLNNCHPYRVTDDIWMAHNGVLSTGNHQDKTKSDTWHFIRNVLAPALEHNPDLLLDPVYQSFIGQMIGASNKFGFVRADGKTVIINEQSGVNFVGAWLSNTYAWSTTKFGFRSSYQGQGYSGYGYAQDDFGYGGWQGNTWSSNNWNTRTHQGISSKQAKIYEEDEGQSAFGVVDIGTREAKGSYEGQASSEVSKLTKHQVGPMVRAAFNMWQRKGVIGVERWVKDAPYKAAALLAYYYDDVDGVEALVESDPSEAAIWIEDLFRTDSVSPSMLM